MPLIASRAGGSATSFGGLGASLTPPYAGPFGAYDSIASTTLSTAAASITFSSIPATYTHLQVRGIGRNSAAANDILLRFNSDSGSNYAFHVLRGSGSSATAAAVATTGGSELGVIAYSGETANVFSAFVVDVLDYANTNKYKTLRVLNGTDTNGSGYVTFGSGLWQSSTAVSTITLTVGGSGNFIQYTSFALYGIKGA